jgi:hypothetical protein
MEAQGLCAQQSASPVWYNRTASVSRMWVQCRRGWMSFSGASGVPERIGVCDALLIF